MHIKVAIVIRKEDTYLLIQENHAHHGRDWNWPQGKVEEGETLEAAAIREGKEETGLDLSLERKITVLMDTFPDTKELHVFLATPISDLFTLPPDEILDAKWLHIDEIQEMEDQLVGKWILETIIQL